MPAPEEDTQPGAPASLPDLALWADSDVGVPLGPAAAFPTNPPARTEDTMPTIGHIGRYALKYRIGAGGLGTVYAAHDPLLSRLIAIKTLNLEISAEERDAFNALFLNEARAAGGLSHPHIVTVFDAGVSQHGGDNSAYIAMELLKGRDLRQLRQEGWRATPAQAALIVRRVADALAYAHSKGVVHRDIKPANIFMVGRTQPRVLDFGIARVAHHHDAGGGGGELAAGSPYYMAPEQVRQQSVDRRADVFSLGVVLYELLCDVKPFRGTTLSEITTAVLEHLPPPANEVDPAVPQALAEIAARAMEKDPEQRYRSARSLSRELRHWIDEYAQAAEAAAPLGAAQPSRKLWLGVGVAGVVVGGLALWAALSPRHGSEPAAALAAPASANLVSVASAASSTATSTSTSAAAALLAAAPLAANAAPNKAAMVAAEPAVTASGLQATPALAGAATKPAPGPTIAKETAKETAKDKRLREAREREAGKLAGATPAPPLPTGVVKIAISPWGQVEVDGAAAGTTPPLNELTLSEGKHQIVIRNEDFPPYSATVTVNPGQPVTLKHKFGS